MIAQDQGPHADRCPFDLIARTPAYWTELRSFADVGRRGMNQNSVKDTLKPTLNAKLVLFTNDGLRIKSHVKNVKTSNYKNLWKPN